MSSGIRRWSEARAPQRGTVLLVVLFGGVGHGQQLLVHVGVEVPEANEVINFTIAKICVDTAESEPLKI